MFSLSDFQPETIDGTTKYNLTTILALICHKLNLDKRNKIDLWLRRNATKALIDNLCKQEGASPSALVVRKRGRYQSGTWAHPKLAEDFITYLINWHARSQQS